MVKQLGILTPMLPPPSIGMVTEIRGTYKVPYHPVEGDPDKVFEVDWTPPFRRVHMIPELEKQLNVTFPPASEFYKPGRWFMRLPVRYCYKCGIDVHVCGV